MNPTRLTTFVLTIGSLAMLGTAAQPVGGDDTRGPTRESLPPPAPRSTSLWTGVSNGIKFNGGNVGIGKKPGNKRLLDVMSTTNGQYAAYFDSAGSNGGDVAIRDGVFVMDEAGKNNLVIMKRIDQQSGYLRVNGSASSVLIHGARAGNDAVQLPASSISAPEIASEAGVANTRSAAVSPSGGGFGPIRSVTLNAPAGGYVLVLASGELEISHTNGAAETKVTFGVSASSLSVNSFQDTDIKIPSGAGTGTWDNGFSAHGLFAVNSGANTFYLVAGMFGPGSASMNDIQLTAVYLPTAYGTVDSNMPQPTDPPAGAGDHFLPARGPMTPYEIALERVNAVQADLDRQRAELNRLQAQLDATTRELDSVDLE